MVRSGTYPVIGPVGLSTVSSHGASLCVLCAVCVCRGRTWCKVPSPMPVHAILVSSLLVLFGMQALGSAVGAQLSGLAGYLHVHKSSGVSFHWVSVLNF